jgi:hypothetical protein
MHKIILFLTAAALAPVTTTINWVGSGNWSNTASWSPAVVPNSSSTVVNQLNSNSITSDIPVVINQFKAASTLGGGVSAGTGSVTFDGINPTLDASAAVASNYVNWRPSTVLNHDLIILGNQNLYFQPSSLITNGHNLILKSGVLSVVSSTVTGAAATGTGFVLINAGPLDPYLQAGRDISNNISFIDSGNHSYKIYGAGFPYTYVFSGKFSGSISHPLRISGGVFAGDWSGLSSSSYIQFDANTAATIPASFPSSQILLGDSVTGGSNLTFSNSLTNNINVTGGVGNAVTVSTSSPVTLSGNIVLNYNSSPSAGNININGNTANITISGVISNGASNSSSFTLEFYGGKTLLTAINSYTSPTYISSASLQVNGSISSSSFVKIDGTGILSGKGTVGPVSIPSSTGHLYSYSYQNLPSTSDILTINGDLNMTSTTSAVYHTIIGAGNKASRLQVNGNVNFGSGAKVVVDSGTTSGIYTIMTITGAFSGTIANPTTGTVSVSGKNLILTIP